MTINYTQSLHIPIIGSAPRTAYPAEPKGTENLHEWRRFVVNKAQEKYAKEIFRGIDTTITFEVTMQFRLLRLRFFSPDLDNLAKPVLDSIFKENAQIADQGISAALFDIDDGRVITLNTSKVVVSTQKEEGVIVNITLLSNHV